MANQPISALNEVLNPSNSDVLPIVSGGETKKIKLENLGNILPTDLKISTASKGGVFNGGFELGTGSQADAAGWIGDEKYGWYISTPGAALTAAYDNTVSHSGKQSLKITFGGGNLTLQQKGFARDILNITKYLPSIKAGSTYKLSGWVKTVAIDGTGVAFRCLEDTESAYNNVNNVTPYLTGTKDWTYVEKIFTAAANTTRAEVGSATADTTTGLAWFDDIKLEEVVTDTTFTGKVAEKSRDIYQAVGGEGIDQSLDPTGAYANTYALTNAINEGATHIQTFQSTKKQIKRIEIWPVVKGTGNWTLVIHDSGNVIKGSYAISNASVAVGAMLSFAVPNLWLTGVYHFHLYSSVADGTCKANTSNDLETASFVQWYYKATETFTKILNGVETKLKADKDGLLSNAIIDLDNGKYRYNGLFNSTDIYTYANDIFSVSVGGVTATPVGINGWGLSPANIGSNSGATERYLTWKVNTLLPLKHLKIQARTYYTGNAIQVSSDNINWTQLSISIADGYVNPINETDLMNGLSTFYIRLFKDAAANTYLTTDYLKIEADLDTSSIPQGLLYPLETNQFTETIKLPSVATRAYFRLAKCQNEYGVVVPAIEFTDASAVSIGCVPLKLDNSQETNPAVAIVVASTTNAQNAGTGTLEGANYILNDGEYMTLSTAVDELSLVYLVGKGTTAFTNITKNTLYLSSNGDSNDATQDPSHQGNFIIGARQQGVMQTINDLQNDIEYLIKNKIPANVVQSLYKIVPSVDASGNMTVSIKDIYGNDFSHNNIGYFKIGDVIRSLTRALTITDNAGQGSRLNLGSAEFATKEADLFPYLVWDTVQNKINLLISRRPNANLVGDFAWSNTAENGIIGSAQGTATDVCVNIGRFAATLSAGAGYTWSVPTFTASNLIQKPIYETRLLDWIPVLTGGNTDMSLYTLAKYRIVRDVLFFNYSAINCTMSGTAGGAISTLPFAGLEGTQYYPYSLSNGAAWVVAFMGVNSAGKELVWYKDAAANNWVANETGVQFHFRGVYNI